MVRGGVGCSMSKERLKITYNPHTRRRMEERDISEEEVRDILARPDLEYPGKLGRIVAERSPSESGRFSSLAVRVIYNSGLQDERIVVTVELGRPTPGTPEPPQEGDEP